MNDSTPSSPPAPPPRQSKIAQGDVRITTGSAALKYRPRPPSAASTIVVDDESSVAAVEEARSFMAALSVGDSMHANSDPSVGPSGSTPKNLRTPYGVMWPHGRNVEPMDPVFALWLRDHPKATRDQINAELRRRSVEIRERERAAHLSMMKSYYDELHALLAADEDMERTVEEGSAHVPPESQQATLDDPRMLHSPAKRCVLPAPDERGDYESQKVAWHILTTRPFASSGVSYHESTAEHVPAVKSTASDMHDVSGWVQRHWRHGTHRHEAAATRIQCSFRCFLAKRKAAIQRTKRRTFVEEMLVSEGQHEDSWIIAVATREESTRAAVTAQRRAHLMRNILTIARAVRERKDAEKSLNEALREETRDYAALRIQTIVRGHLARLRTRELRHPEIALAAKLQAHSNAAVKIQRLVRGHVTRRRLKMWQQSALHIQKSYRRHLAARRVAELHRVRTLNERRVVEKQAAAILRRFFRFLVRRKYAALSNYAPEFRLLQRVGRGFLTRFGHMALLRSTHRTYAATIIQSVVRMHQSRPMLTQRRASLSRDFEAARKNHAAVVITNAISRYTRRKQLQRTVLRDTAARTIQRVVRGRLGRRRALVARETAHEFAQQSYRFDAAVTIQAAIRGHLTRQRLHRVPATPRNTSTDDKINSVRMLQRCYRENIRLPRLVNEINTAARIVTNFFQCLSSRKLVRALRRQVNETITRDASAHAAETIQRWARVVLARIEAEEKRQSRLFEYNRVRQSEASMVITRFFRRLCQQKNRTLTPHGD